jgi:Domain of unknown function (DUF4307)
VEGSVPADRYGRSASRGRRALLAAILAAVVAGALAWFAFAAFSGSGSANGEDIGFDVVSDSTVQVTFDVTKPKDKSATCTVQALDKGFAVVGTVQVQIGPSKQSVVRRTTTVHTTNRATTGRVDTCSITH